jgi:hypothetical protein
MYWYIMHSFNGHGELQMHLSILQQVTTLFLFLVHVATVLAIPVVNFAQHNLFQCSPVIGHLIAIHHHFGTDRTGCQRWRCLAFAAATRPPTITTPTAPYLKLELPSFQLIRGPPSAKAKHDITVSTTGFEHICSLHTTGSGKSGQNMTCICTCTLHRYLQMVNGFWSVKAVDERMVETSAYSTG